MVQPVTPTTTTYVWSRLNIRNAPSWPLASVDVAKVHARGPETIGGHGRELVGEVCPGRVNAEGSDRKRSAYHQRVEFRHNQRREATDLQLA